MIATAKGRYNARRAAATPDLNYFREHYPATVANFGALSRREEWLLRAWETEARWRHALGADGNSAREVIVRSAPPAGVAVEDEFDIIYVGGSLGLLHAAVLACRYGRKVLVFDSEMPECSGRAWIVSDEELKEFENSGLFSREEIESAVVNRYQAGFVKFHDAASTVKADPLWVSGVMDVAVEPSVLLGLAAKRIRSNGPTGCVLLAGCSFVRAYLQTDRITIEVVDDRSRVRRFAARIFVDAGHGDSVVARQIRNGRAVSHVCPSVGTVARGYAGGEGPDRIDFRSGEILVSTEDASEHRQLMWEGFPGAPRRGEYTACLFFHDDMESQADKSLLSLFERYFQTLPSYKRQGAQWRIDRPVFGYAPVGPRRAWRGREPVADDRVMLLGEAAGFSASWGSSGMGKELRNLRRQTHLTHLALEADALDATSLGEVCDCGKRTARTAALAEFLRPTPKSAPPAVNETLNAVMAALHGLDERVRRQLLQDRLTLGSLKSVLSRTVQLYPRILARVREHLGARGTFWWLASVADEFWSERKSRREQDGSDSSADEPARSFAHHVALYKKEQDADG
jgi:lycopene cyclase CruA